METSRNLSPTIFGMRQDVLGLLPDWDRVFPLLALVSNLGTKEKIKNKNKTEGERGKTEWVEKRGKKKKYKFSFIIP